MTEHEGRQAAGAPRRLVESSEPVASASEAWAVELLRSEAPYEAPAGRKQRVQLSLGHVPARRAPLVLRAAVAAVVLLGCGAIASAALGRGRWPAWMARAYERLVPSSAPRASALGESHARAHRSNAAEPALERAPAPPVAVPPVAALPAAPASPAPRRAVALALASQPTVEGEAAVAARARRAAAPPAAPAATEDTSPVLEAMRALRLEHNPVHARALLARYLERHPTGTLAEEALAITIEAAVAHRDADAATLSARYLRLYPLGPFRSIAQQTLAASSAATP